ncbi:MAG: hypothetical protein HYZ73_03545 [Elusimicrobia bacterium]|nr:hypothetical protein [Elusimicrobiota bacterium]
MSFKFRTFVLVMISLALAGSSPSHAVQRDPLEAIWSTYPSLPVTIRQGLTALFQQAQRERLPTELLTKRLLEGLAKRVDPTLLTHRLEVLLGQLRAGRALLNELNLESSAVNDPPCIQGIATLLDWGISSGTVRQVHAMWAKPPTCPALLRATEWNFVTEKDGIPWPHRAELLHQAAASTSVERLPFLWMKGRTLGLGARQVLAILKKDFHAGQSEAQILADFERVAEILADVEGVSEPLLPGSREEERIRQRLGTTPP